MPWVCHLPDIFAEVNKFIARFQDIEHKFATKQEATRGNPIQSTRLMLTMID
jgi:hypothetical protein